MFSIKDLDDAHGGAERVLAGISSGLTERRHDVLVLSFDQSGGRYFYPLNKNKESSINSNFCEGQGFI